MYRWFWKSGIFFFSRAKHIVGHFAKNPKKWPIICFAPDKKKISRTFKIRGALVFLCEEKRETRYERRETRDKRREMRDERWETRDDRRQTTDDRRVSERIKVRAIIFLNRLGQNEKSADFTGKSSIVCISLSLGAVSYVLSRWIQNRPEKQIH